MNLRWGQLIVFFILGALFGPMLMMKLGKTGAPAGGGY